jgi:tRNA(Ile)-lysidine synthase
MDDNRDPIRPEELDGLFARFAALGPCALAVSGGSDSTALMVLFADWLRQRGRSTGSCTVLTVDHGLRASSADEARAVAAGAAELGYRHATLVWEGSKPRAGIQAAARSARYRLMGGYMRAHAIGLLLTAHTRDDQAETLLMRLARGSGLDGLAAMVPLSPLGERGPGDISISDGGRWIGRPFLDVPKACLGATLESRGIRWMEDPSNIAPEFERARLRAVREHLDVLGLTPDMLALSAARLARARRAIERMVDDLCDPHAGGLRIDPCGVILLDRAPLRDAGEEIALRVLERAVLAAGGSGERVPLAKLEAVLDGIRGPRSVAPGRWTLARALITAEPSAVRVEREPGREPLPEIAMAPGTAALWDGRFRVTVAAGFAGGPVRVRPLGEAGLRDLRRRAPAAESAPARAAAAVPSIWHEDRLIAVPPLHYWAPPHTRDEIGAVFVGIACATKAPYWGDGRGPVRH